MAIFLWSTPVLTDPKWAMRWCLKEKIWQTCCNQNLPALPLSDDLKCWSTITFSYNCSMWRIRVFLSANEPMLHRLVSHCFNSLLTFSVMESRVKWAYLELQKVKTSEALKSKKKNPLFSYINSGKLETTVTPRLHYTRLDFTMLPFLTYLTYL